MSLKDYILASPAFSGSRPPVWGRFDAEWYRTRYARLLREEKLLQSNGSVLDLSNESLEKHWLEQGASQGLSPNRFFDEEWYLRQNPDVRDGISYGVFSCGFLHYCESGFRSRSPHWLFSETDYFTRNTDLSLPVLISQGFCNGYDHYLTDGEQEQRQAHAFFKTSVFRMASLTRGLSYDFGKGDFRQFLMSSEAGLCRSSWYFDPEWYLATYPEVESAIQEGIFLNALHHYLTNADPSAYNPNQWFSEAHYAHLYPDVAQIVAGGGFRNGYDHFVRYGAREMRTPQIDVDLRTFSEQPGIQRKLREGQFRDVFALWVQSQGNIAVNQVIPDASAEQYRNLDLQRAGTLIPSIVRSPLDFRLIRPPEISVVIPVTNQFLETLSTLAALHANGAGALDIIIVDSGSSDETTQIERLVRGIRVVRPASRTTTTDQVGHGVELARAGIVLLMEPGTQPFPNTLRVALRAFDSPNVWAVGGQSLGLDGRVLEAGTIVWRDASTLRFGTGQRANESEIGFCRQVDAISVGMLFCRREKLIECGGIDQFCIGSEARLLSLCLALRQAGGKIVYDPSILDRTRPPTPFPEEFLKRNQTWLKRRFSAMLSRCPMTGTSLFRARFASGVPTVLVLCETLPHRFLGSPHLRTQELILSLSRKGYHVTVFPLDVGLTDPVTVALDFPSNVEIMNESDISELPEFLNDRAGSFDFVWVTGGNTLHRTGAILRAHAAVLPRLNMVLDLDGTAAAESYLRRRIGLHDDREQMLDDLDRELTDAWMCQALVCSHAEEAENLRALGYSNVLELTHAPRSIPATVPGFHDRAGILFALPCEASGSAAHDGLDWFVHQVLHELSNRLPPDATVLFAGHRGRDIDLTPYTRAPGIEPLPDSVDMNALYRSRRIMIDPSRVMGAPAQEILEAAAAGLPAVLTDTTMHQLGWTAEAENCVAGGYCNPVLFAEAIIRLYNNEDLWNHVSHNARKFVANLSETGVADRQLDDILALASGQVPVAVPAHLPRMIRQDKPLVPVAPAPIRLQPRKTTDEQPTPATPEPYEPQEDTSAPTTLAPRLGISLPLSEL
ncbi:glycosyl transferase [Gluconobacter thailandicus F149-1 = NBRC 100600]|uniref:Glycosyl transferase family protein n=1 Tax=Gluconobacter thailandicus NBRC 3257 TaxID=1381097 RepID=A0ABQ0J091_GLUTH|nr:glycosyltransferase [Gluconobacter thailandicus]KXV52965.1 glycosyl transferase [Gluconobacter thailandicus]GAC86671.1 glycosyl transferase family protein [Gluconobacter thailandicus NBRC 3255]GAD27857.1 glycosyl transferase family protein [Gluconobacter thailandicus NBRC 3257]GAN93294.1 glycosyl transferase [Gluconobacter thailandicus F149-1 = NBRC 100600]GBR59585.1 glycosyl transferase family protein [Gluconobacter thailandicus F149-1 = NBRC 100600]